MKSLGDLLEPELSVIRAQLLSEFSPDNVCPLGAQLPMDAQHRVYKAGTGENKSIEGASILSIDDDDDEEEDDTFLEPFEGQVKDSSEFSGEIPRLEGVNQLLASSELVLGQINSTDPFKQLIDPLPMPCATVYHNHSPFFCLPDSTPYDNFLNAAGC
ncbi:uncharacterized protein LOC120183953 [Hibiscus syriacus]|uniref:uncharacterized protein LOC120183953 n=1 Tax=Hibiscus syriacus TaxID=106335 RepID=UPI0019243B85|nr:uncharacterized protein LOC120183953 [Hibiscus syriacus]